VFSELFELTLALRIVGLDEGKLEEPEAPTEVFEALALLEVLGDLCADFPCFRECIAVGNLPEGRKGFVSLWFNKVMG